MNANIEFIKSRKSCRAFTPQQIKEENLQEILACGLCAPSGMNQQGIYFSVIQDANVLDQIHTMVGRKCTYGAPTLIVVHCDEDYKYAQNDGSLAIGNMYLAAHALGLGSCWINQLKDYYGNPLLKTLGLDNQIIIGSLAVGYADGALKEKTIKENRVTYIR